MKNYNEKKILVTGGAGFIGSSLCRFLLDKGAYVSVSLLGSASKPACQSLTQNICAILSGYGIDGSGVYVTYHPVDLWGWNGSMF